MNLKNYFGEIKHFLKENADDFSDFYDFDDEDTGEIPPEDGDDFQGEEDEPDNTAEQPDSPPTVPPSEDADPPSEDVDPPTTDTNTDEQPDSPPTAQEETKKFGTILGELKNLFDAFEQAKKAAGFETIDDVKKAAEENQADDNPDGDTLPT